MSPPPSITIGPYTILETVGARAFTVTYRAREEALGRTVLLRTLKPTVSLGTPLSAELGREARILARLDHEGIVRLHDYLAEGRVESAPVLVLEDAGATPLDEILRHARPEPDVAAAVALAAARALGHAHERGVVHRALGAAVVGIAPRGRLLITDFSAAGLHGGAAAGAEDLPALPEPIEAADALTRGTPAPEQILGEEAGPASDVWALGALLHELLSGAHPFRDPAAARPAARARDRVSAVAAATPAPTDDSRALAQRIRTAPPAPLPSSAPESLARIVARCLAKDPLARFPDGNALAAALEEALGDLSLLPGPVLISRARAAARGGEALTPGAAVRPPPRTAPPVDVPAAGRRLAAVLLLVVAGAAGLRLLDDPDAGEGAGVPESAPLAAGSHDQGMVRVVAKPWAEVYVDGELVDVTPVGRPIPVSPGRHFVTFRHPAAPDEQRAIKIAPGQSVFLDVTMRVDRGDAGAPRDAGPKVDSP